MYADITASFARAVDIQGSWEERVASILEIAADLYRDDAVLQRLGGVARLEAAQDPKRFRAIVTAQNEVEAVFEEIVFAAVESGVLPRQINIKLGGELLSGVVMIAIARLTNKRTTHDEFREIIKTFKCLFLSTELLFST